MMVFLSLTLSMVMVKDKAIGEVKELKEINFVMRGEASKANKIFTSWMFLSVTLRKVTKMVTMKVNCKLLAAFNYKYIHLHCIEKMKYGRVAACHNTCS